MSAAVDTRQPAAEGLHNGDVTHNGSHQNGHSALHNGNSQNGLNGTDDDAWEEQFLPPPLVLKDMNRAREVERVVSGLVVSGAAARRAAGVFRAELERGLRRQPSSLQMENTYVPELPDGTESGEFLALDLGGTNFRVLLLRLMRGQLLHQDVQHYHISQELRLGTGEALFDFLAECVQDFLTSRNLQHKEFSLGFTFSFPMRQHSISSGELLTWTKSFKCSGMAGVDVAALLQRRLAARRLRVTVRVLLNDTTGTLVAGAHHHNDVVIGVILGTGSNGCYMEAAERVPWEQQSDARDVCVDIEWGAFGDNGCIDFIKTDFDREVDQNSLLTSSFTFEKYIGGKYVGCAAGAALRRLAGGGLLPAAPAPHTLTAAHLSLFEEERVRGEVVGTLATLAGVCGGLWGEEDARVVQHVGHLVARRAALLVAVCLSVLASRVRGSRPAAAVDGSVYKRHPTLRHLLAHYLALLAPNHPLTLLEAEDGSGKGSALTAAIAARLAGRHH